MLFARFRRNRIIDKAVKKTVADFSGRSPQIYQHFYYGAFDEAPQYLVIWYLFETDAQLESAKETGLCDALEKTTIKNLLDFGYPKEAFEITNLGPAPKITFLGGTEEEQNYILHSITH